MALQTLGSTQFSKYIPFADSATGTVDYGNANIVTTGSMEVGCGGLLCCGEAYFGDSVTISRNLDVCGTDASGGLRCNRIEVDGDLISRYASVTCGFETCGVFFAGGDITTCGVFFAGGDISTCGDIYANGFSVTCGGTVDVAGNVCISSGGSFYMGGYEFYLDNGYVKYR